MEHTPYNPEDYRVHKRIIKGIIKGAKDLKDIVLHPIDNIVYPVSELVHDAIILTLQHQVSKNKHNHHPSLYKSMLEKNPNLYVNSRRRMQEKINNAKQSIKDFSSSPLEQQVEYLSTLGTCVLVPGGIIKNVKCLRGLKKISVGVDVAHNLPNANSNESITNIPKEESHEDALRNYFREKAQNNARRFVEEDEFTARDDVITRYSDMMDEVPNNPEELYSMLMQEVPVKVEDAKQAYQKLILCSQEFYLEEPKVNIREQLILIAEPIHNFGVLGQNLSQLGILTGGHKRTWNNIGKVAQGSITIASSLTSIASASSMLSLGAISGGIGLAIGAIGLISGLFGDDEDDSSQALEQIHQAIMGVHQAIIDMHNSMIECFQRVEEVLIVCVIQRLNVINNNLSRLERIATTSFKELHTKDLIDITDALKKEIIGEHILTNSEKRSYLRRLSCWIDNHSKSCLQTQSLRNGTDVSKIIEILEETNLVESLPLFLLELSNIIPELKQEIGNISNLPNIEVLTIACDVYMIVSTKSGYINNKETIIRAKQVFSDISNNITILTKFNICGESIINILTRQYDTYRLWIGQLICKIRGCQDWSKIDSPLYSTLKEGQETSSLLQMIDEMELRRLCLTRVCKLLNIKLILLESKKDILGAATSSYIQRNIHSIYNTKQIKEYLQTGTDPNNYDSWGRPIHYLTKGGGSTTHLHLLFKTHPILSTEMTGTTQYDQGDTWGAGASPILHAMNNGRYDMGVLFCANGFNIRELDGRHLGSIPFNSTDMGNAYWWRDLNSVPSIINTSLVKLMNTPENKLYRDYLRTAYKYYKLVESGNFPEITNFTVDSLILLTCVIGDIFPLKYYLYKNNQDISNLLNEPIVGLDITYLQFAKACHQPIVVSYFEECGGVLNINLSTEVESLYDKDGKDPLPLIWQVNTGDISLSPKDKSIINKIADINLKIETYLTISAKPKIRVSEDCILFRDLLGEIILDVDRTNKFYSAIMKLFKSLNEAINIGDIKTICSAFNSLNSILVTTKGLLTPYAIYSGIVNLIDSIKSEDN